MQLSLPLNGEKLSANHQEPNIECSSTSVHECLPNPTKASSLRDLALKMQPTIDQKKNPSINEQRPTRRRKLIAMSIMKEGLFLENVQSWLLAIAHMWEIGNIPTVLRNISHKSQVETLLKIYNSNLVQEWDEILSNGNYEDWVKSVGRAGLHSSQKVAEAIEAIIAIVQPKEYSSTLRLNELELEVIGMKGRDFFPTPLPVCQQMIALANVQNDWRILEPSAGSGCIAECLKSTCSHLNIYVDVVEISHTLREILEIKGFNVVGQDFTEFHPNLLYNACIMNPPFSELVEHIYHAWKLLRTGGTLVSIVPNSVFFSREYKTFKVWLTSNNAEIVSVEDGSFLNSINPTGVATSIVKLIKPLQRDVF